MSEDIDELDAEYKEAKKRYHTAGKRLRKAKAKKAGKKSKRKKKKS